jgi:peptidyl-prolyl cis-trans isomerase A (cyclophilin A)
MYLFIFSCVLLGADPAPQEKKNANPIVIMETSMGTIKIELFQDKAPITVRNFLKYVEKKHYDGTLFHRVINNFMIQGGGLKPGFMEKGAEAPIKNESYNGLSNTRGTLAMAREDIPDGATDQFFINVRDNPFLDKARNPDRFGYCVFGKVVEGMDVVDKIKAVPTRTLGKLENVPRKDVLIKSVKLAK